MDFFEILLRVFCGGVVGFFIGLTGVGGGVILMPVLTVVLGLPATVTVGTASFYSVLTKIYASVEHFRLKTVNLSASFLFLFGAIPGDLATSILINRYILLHADSSQKIEQFQGYLKLLIVIVMLFSAALVMFNAVSREKIKSGKTPFLRKILGIVLGIIVGCLLGATSIGGGVLIIPLLIIFFGLTLKETVGSSIFVALVLTLLTSVVYGKDGQLDFKTGIIMWLGSLGGVFVGSKLCVKISDRILKIIVILIILISAVTMVTTNNISGH
ncbi:MAG TPA: sulfite exporter TauE/SafE family protein [Victivallales bacterium]|mgnify:CR=1 FL=1|nr:sulfite exporter TauE/SafE family protein [Victivallales bacterium]